MWKNQQIRLKKVVNKERRNSDINNEDTSKPKDINCGDTIELSGYVYIINRIDCEDLITHNLKKSIISCDFMGMSLSSAFNKIMGYLKINYDKESLNKVIENINKSLIPEKFLK